MFLYDIESSVSVLYFIEKLKDPQPNTRNDTPPWLHFVSLQRENKTRFINNLKANDYEEKQHLGSPSEDCHRGSNRGIDSIGNNGMHGTVSIMDDIRLSPHFTLAEFCNQQKYPANAPSTQHVVNMTYGCHLLLEPARQKVGPIIINSGFRNERVNRLVGGVAGSQHLVGQAADIRPRDPRQFQRLVDFLRQHALTDQLLTGTGWLHISWNPFAQPRHYVRIGYYK